MLSECVPEQFIKDTNVGFFAVLVLFKYLEFIGYNPNTCIIPVLAPLVDTWKSPFDVILMFTSAPESVFPILTYWVVSGNVIKAAFTSAFVS